MPVACACALPLFSLPVERKLYKRTPLSDQRARVRVLVLAAGAAAGRPVTSTRRGAHSPTTSSARRREVRGSVESVVEEIVKL